MLPGLAMQDARKTPVTPVPQVRTLLLTDLCDSVALVEKLGDAAAAELFQQHVKDIEGRSGYVKPFAFGVGTAVVAPSALASSGASGPSCPLAKPGMPSKPKSNCWWYTVCCTCWAWITPIPATPTPEPVPAPGQQQ